MCNTVCISVCLREKYTKNMLISLNFHLIATHAILDLYWVLDKIGVITSRVLDVNRYVRLVV